MRSILGGLRQPGSYPETGFAEISSDVPEAAFWPVSLMIMVCSNWLARTLITTHSDEYG